MTIYFMMHSIDTSKSFDTTIMLGPHQFSLQATVDHYGHAIYSGYYTTIIYCCEKIFYCNGSKISNMNRWMLKTPQLHM